MTNFPQLTEIYNVGVTLNNTFSFMMIQCEGNTESGPRLNIKTVLSTYGDFHVKDKTAVRTSYL